MAAATGTSVWSASERTRAVQQGALSWCRAVVADVGSGCEAPLIRELLEAGGVSVEFCPIGQPRHLVAVLDGSGLAVQPQLLVISGHGEEGRLLVPELAPELEAAQPFHGGLAASDVAAHFRGDGAIVISTACATGTPDLARAFLGGGALAYVAPTGYPEGSAALLVVHLMVFGLLSGWNVSETLQKAYALDAQFEQWGVWPS